MAEKEILELEGFLKEAPLFAEHISSLQEPSLFGTTDGKAIGTYIEAGFRDWLTNKYVETTGSAAKGIDFPNINVDVKTTKYTQPQSSCPFKNAGQKMYGLGYHLLVFVYDKTDDAESKSAQLKIKHTIFIDQCQTADYTLTKRTLEMLEDDANDQDLIAYFTDRNLPLDDIGLQNLADRVLASPPEQGYLTISNALQWRLQYKRAIDVAGDVDGVYAL